MIDSTEAFIAYAKSVRRRTLRYAHAVPPEQINWAVQAGEFTCGDILRHIVSAEKMFIHLITDGSWLYHGHASEQESLAELISLLEDTHKAAMDALSTLPDAALHETRPAFEGDAQIKTWRWLMAMLEHEIHHRSQLASYLLHLGVTPPHIYGAGVEDLIARATG